MFPYGLLGYRTIITTSIEATPYLLVYGTEAVIPAEVEILSLRIIQEEELSNAKWVSKWIDQLALINEKENGCHFSWTTIPTENDSFFLQENQSHNF